MGAVVENISILFKANLSQLSKGLKSAKSQLTSFGSGIGKLGSNIGGGLAKAAKVGAIGLAGLAAAATAAAAALAALAASQISYVSEVNKLAQSTGASTEGISALGYAAKSLGLDLDIAGDAFKEMNLRLGEATALGSGPAIDALNKLGVSLDSIKNLSPESQLATLSDALAGVSDQAEKAFLAEELFGSSAEHLLPVLQQGSEGLQRYAKEADKLGVIVSSSTASGVAKAMKAFNQMKTSLAGIGQTLLGMFAPFIEWFGSAMTQLNVYINNFVSQFKPHMEVVFSIWQGVWNGIYETFKSIWSGFLSLFGSSFGSFKDDFLKGLIAVEYGIQNWGKRWEMVTIGNAHRLVWFVDQTKNFFLNAIPQILVTAAKNFASVFETIGSNIKNFWKAIQSWIAGEGFVFDFDLEPIKKRMAETAKEMKKAFDAPESELAKSLRTDLEKRQKQYKEGLAKFTNERMKSFAADDKKDAASLFESKLKEVQLPTIKTDVDLGGMNEVKEKVELELTPNRGGQAGNGALLAKSQATYDFIAEFQRIQAADKQAMADKQRQEQIRLAKETATYIKKMAKRAKEEVAKIWQ